VFNGGSKSTVVHLVLEVGLPSALYACIFSATFKNVCHWSLVSAKKIEHYLCAGLQLLS
jgi:hypothetical protein